MKDAIFLIFEPLVVIAKLLGPGGSRVIIAENLLLKQQLLVHSRARQRAPNLSVLMGQRCAVCSTTPSSGPRLTWRTSSTSIRRFTTSAALTLGKMGQRLWKRLAVKPSISISTDGTSIVAGYLNCQ
jgi:hypothetical protein